MNNSSRISRERTERLLVNDNFARDPSPEAFDSFVPVLYFVPGK